MASLISDQGYYTFHYGHTEYNRVGGRKVQTNRHGFGSAPSARRGEVYVILLVHSVFLWANASLYSSENSHKATSNADLNSRVGQPCICRSTGPSSHLSDFCWLVSPLPCFHLLLSLLSFLQCPSLDWPLMLTVLFSSFLLTVFWDLPYLVLPVSWEISSAGPLCGFHAKTDKGILWLAPTHTPTQRMPNTVLRYYAFRLR